jgi:hypothetical protein
VSTTTPLQTIEKNKLETKNPNVTVSASKALPTNKRAATTAAAGADKRKKALKRL